MMTRIPNTVLLSDWVSDRHLFLTSVGDFPGGRVAL